MRAVEGSFASGVASRDRRVTRRAMLQSAAASLAAGSLCRSPVLAAETESPKRVVVGAHPWVYAATQPNYDIYPILDRIFADMSFAGIEGIELMHSALFPDGAVERIAALSKQHCLPVIGMSFHGDMWNRDRHAEILKEAELAIPRLERLGGYTLGTSVGATGKLKTPEQLDAQAELLRKVIALAKRHGVTLSLHNHTYEVEHNLHDLKGTLARIPDAKLGPDLNWLVRGGVDPVAFIRQYGSRIVFLHLRDQKADGKWSEAMGEGAMDYVAIGKALHEIGFCGPAVIELAHESQFKLTRPLRESLKMSRQFVRTTLGY